jgi:hypothetical protein
MIEGLEDLSLDKAPGIVEDELCLGVVNGLRDNISLQSLTQDDTGIHSIAQYGGHLTQGEICRRTDGIEPKREKNSHPLPECSLDRDPSSVLRRISRPFRTDISSLASMDDLRDHCIPCNQHQFRGQPALSYHIHSGLKRVGPATAVAPTPLFASLLCAPLSPTSLVRSHLFLRHSTPMYRESSVRLFPHGNSDVNFSFSSFLSSRP